MRVGSGWDLHRLVEKRPLMLGGVQIPHTRGEAGHSDGDVLIHAIIDALLGAVAIGDIGSHFPPSDDRWKDVSSLELLQMTLEKIKGWKIVNIDTTVILENPKLRPYIDAIRDSLSQTCDIPIECISVKAKTAEGILGEVGQGEAIIAQAIVLLKPVPTDNCTELDEWV
ncbi:2-C-methyl-D-erythritol 2,4-cyclodiphosphate synthase [Pleomorphochaeta sp. DL1XJH-081]|uniref:2-C-methyl-D-erythritol 2,4-cyclodiphosphate synthase n=1 Tax=Pleomorphochaeta sp. DL1XJH-081 TaxID=3409690 RepID=UPI003BB7490C